MTEEAYPLPSYPTIRFIVGHGRLLAFAIALVPLFAGMWCTANGLGVSLSFLGLAGGVVLGGLLMSYVEVLRVLSDTLISR